MPARSAPWAGRAVSESGTDPAKVRNRLQGAASAHDQALPEGRDGGAGLKRHHVSPEHKTKPDGTLRKLLGVSRLNGFKLVGNYTAE